MAPSPPWSSVSTRLPPVPSAPSAANEASASSKFLFNAITWGTLPDTLIGNIDTIQIRSWRLELGLNNAGIPQGQRVPDKLI